MSTTPDSTDPNPIRLAFVCVQNAGRSQMATAFAERERAKRGLEDAIDIITGGTHPADHVHEIVIEAMSEEQIDLADRTPREITTDELETCDYVATMGCSTLDLGAAASDVELREWDLPNPDGKDLETVRTIRDETDRRVRQLFDDVSAALE